MENEIRNNDIALLSMLEARADMNDDDRQMAELARKFELCETKKEHDFKRLRQYAAIYFNKEKISELHRLDVDLLKSEDFNEEDYIKKFSDATKIKLDDINFLIDIENNINEVRKKLDSNEVLSSEDEVQIRGISKVMSTIADILSRKDGVNND